MRPSLFNQYKPAEFIGFGPAEHMATEVLVQVRVQVDFHDAMPSVAINSWWQASAA